MKDFDSYYKKWNKGLKSVPKKDRLVLGLSFLTVAGVCVLAYFQAPILAYVLIVVPQFILMILALLRKS